MWYPKTPRGSWTVQESKLGTKGFYEGDFKHIPISKNGEILGNSPSHTGHLTKTMMSSCNTQITKEWELSYPFRYSLSNSADLVLANYNPLKYASTSMTQNWYWYTHYMQFNSLRAVNITTNEMTEPLPCRTMILYCIIVMNFHFRITSNHTNYII